MRQRDRLNEPNRLSGSNSWPETNKLVVSSDLASFFRSEIIGARNALHVKLKPLAEYYLVQLLCDFSGGHARDMVAAAQPLALMYERARNEVGEAQRAQRYKDTGDVALWVSGFFSDSIDKSWVDVDYYVAMGGSAYSHLSGMVGQKARGDTFAELYQHLAAHFVELVDVLNHVADRARHRNDQNRDLLRLYDRYARTGSMRIRKMLLEKGLLPAPRIPLAYDH